MICPLWEPGPGGAGICKRLHEGDDGYAPFAGRSYFRSQYRYKDEERLLMASENVDETYINEVLPQKMQYNLDYLKDYSFGKDLKIMLKTVAAVCH